MERSVRLLIAYLMNYVTFALSGLTVLAPFLAKNWMTGAGVSVAVLPLAVLSWLVSQWSTRARQS